MSRIPRRPFACLALSAVLFACPAFLLTPARAETVTVGAGSYLVGTSGKEKGQPVRGPNLTGSIPTQQWFSNLVFKGAAANNEFPHPLAVRPTSAGLMIHYPGNGVSAAKGGISGGGMPKTGADLTLSATDASSFNTVALDGFSDWFIKVAFLSAGDKGMHVTYGHGSPFVYATYDTGGAALSCGKNPNVWSKDGSVLGLTVGNSHYGLFGPSDTSWSVDGGKISNIGAPGKNYFSVALLPDNTPETLALFKKYAYAHVTDTQTAWKLDDTGHMRVTFNFTTKPYEGMETGTVTALYPHQWKYVDEKASTLTKNTYNSVRGTMKIATGTSFTTATPIQGILPALPAQGIADKGRIQGYMSEMPNGGGTGETYGGGKAMGKLASYASIAEVIGDNASKDKAVSSLKRAVENWLSYSDGERNTYFVYNKSWGNLTGVGGGYGADWPFNDHHFHYGYMIRAAAEIARADPAWAEKWGPMVELVIRECASPDRNDPLFPNSRCFDRYEGHGWASGDAGFEAGNNNESSSESMNCWYGITMWGAATGNTALRDFGLYMFTTDMTAIEEYWFDVSDTNFPKSYPHESVGMVWGNGAAWGTWFSGDPNKITGIQYLPYTPGSVYLVRYPDYIQRAYPALNVNADWGDLMIMFHAGQDPADAMKLVDATPNMKVEGGNSRAFLYQWCSTLNTFGTIDRTVTADYPHYNVYNKNGKKTYAVYNFDGKPLTVKFTDGMKVTSTSKGMTVVTE
jgi:endoglucanase Acf2